MYEVITTSDPSELHNVCTHLQCMTPSALVDHLNLSYQAFEAGSPKLTPSVKWRRRGHEKNVDFHASALPPIKYEST